LEFLKKEYGEYHTDTNILKSKSQEKGQFMITSYRDSCMDTSLRLPALAMYVAKRKVTWRPTWMMRGLRKAETVDRPLSENK
jgi:hypothetical protein